MTKNHLYWINVTLGGVAMILMSFAAGLHFTRSEKISMTEMIPKQTELPRGSFVRNKEDYSAIGPPFLYLDFTPLSLQLPDLRNCLVYYGRNERPDADPEQSALHFAFSGSKDAVSILPNQPLYLVYDNAQPRTKYLFSPDNRDTSLWIESSAEEKEASVQVAMKNEAGETIREPEQHAHIKLKAKEIARYGGEKWELGKWRVDGTLFARQRARWYGQDLFLDEHGGEEWEKSRGKERIDFADGDHHYSMYLAAGDCAAWAGNRWKEIEPGEKSRQYPLLVVSKVDERLMKMELWDVRGKVRIPLNLIKSTETSTTRQNMNMAFKFVGARTKSQLTFEVNNERLLLCPKDWLLLLDGQWNKLTTPEEIDDYVNRNKVGPLLVFNDVATDEEGRQVLRATHYSPARTEVRVVEIPLQQTSKAKPLQHHSQIKKAASIEDEDDDDEDEEDDDDDDDDPPFAYADQGMEEVKKYKDYLGKFHKREKRR
ncbi:MAG: hypothetical protein WB791_03635 [Waddliaceae bacterium]